MAFTPGQSTKTGSSSGFVPGQSAKSKTQSGFVPGGSAGNSGATPKISSKQLKNVEGLTDFAGQTGLEKPAQRALEKHSGENPNKFGSGGLVTDFFDVINASSYGVVGVLKGKSFSEGVKTRQSFADKDALGQFGVPGIIAGTALDIAVDPFTWIAPATVLKKVPGLSKAAKASKEAVFGRKVSKTIEGTDKTFETIEGGTTAGKWAADKFVYMFGKDPAYRKGWERMQKNIAVGGTAVKQMTKAMLDLPEEKFDRLLQLGDDFRFERRNVQQLKEFLTDDEILKVQGAFEYVDELGQQMVDLKLLDKKVFEANKGKYIKAFYTQYAEKEMGNFAYNPTKISKKFARKSDEDVVRGYLGKLSKEEIEEKFPGVLSGDGKIQTGIFKRDFPQTFKQIFEEAGTELNKGAISNPAYIFAKTATGMLKDIESAKFFDEIGRNFGTDKAQEGFKLISKANMGALKGKYIPESIANDLESLISQPSDFGKALQRATSEYKFFKVVLNPASNIRNIISNKLLNYFDEAGMPLYRLDQDVGGLKSYLNKDEWYKEVEALGGTVDTFRSNEIGDLIDISGVGKLGGNYNKFKEYIGNIYQGEEMMAKMSMYKYQRISKGLPPEKAWEIAERATFNYAQVTPFVHRMRTNLFGFPFLTFTVKSTPVIAKTVAKNPTKISNIGKARNNIEKLAGLEETEREREAEPSWMRNGFYMKLPFKDDKGRSGYLDLTYILPFGDLALLGDENNLSIFAKSPALGIIRDIGRNEDYFGNKIWKESDSIEKKGGDMMRYMTKALLPPPVADQIPGGYDPKTGERTDYGRLLSSLDADETNQRRTLMQEMAKMVGMKVQPIDADVQEGYQEWNQRQELEKVLIENSDKTGINESRNLYQQRD